MPEPSNKATYTITHEDFVAAHKLARRSGRITTSVSSIVCFVVTIALLQAWSLAVEKRDTSDLLRSGAVDIGLGAIGILGWCFIFALFIRPRKIRKIYDQQAELRNETTVTWSSDGLHWVSDRGTQNIPWRDLVKRRENEDLILLYQSDAIFNMIPKRVLSESQREILEAHLAATPTKA